MLSTIRFVKWGQDYSPDVGLMDFLLLLSLLNGWNKISAGRGQATERLPAPPHLAQLSWEVIGFGSDLEVGPPQPPQPQRPPAPAPPPEPSPTHHRVLSLQSWQRLERIKGQIKQGFLTRV